MRIGTLRFLVAGTALSLCQLVSAGDLLVTLSLATPVLKRGEVPHFAVTVHSTTRTVRVLRFQSRGDLRANYAELRVTKDDENAHVPVMISDPGPIDEQAFVELKKGEELHFEHDGSPLVLSELPPGTYSAVLLLQPDARSEPIRSNEVTFRVQ
jgi:hypothetical protein